MICGATATGKTSLALKLAEKFNGEIVSADSRQVYKHMNIGTGKDIPEDFWVEASSIPFQGKKVPYYTNGKTKIWGYDLVHPKSEFSVAQYTEIAHAIISDIHARGKLPILAGGTGLYVKGVVDGIGSSAVPKNSRLREELSEKKVDELQKILYKKDPLRFSAMNNSDKNNPRRLVRAIEIAGFTGEVEASDSPRYNTLFIGLKIARDELEARINARVEARMKEGQREEVSSLLEKGVKWEDQSMSSIGYKEWRKYFDKESALPDVSRVWKLHERKYAKRQRTWFKAEPRINWFNALEVGLLEKVEKLVKTWHNN